MFGEIKHHLNATKTERALSPFVPNTFLENKAATVTPELLISCGVAALRKRVRMSISIFTKQRLRTQNKPHLQEDIELHKCLIREDQKSSPFVWDP